jgi:cytochrome d ubiquinol oxidase subunit I
MPLLANSFGWIFTEMGRQPWTVFGVFKTAARGLAGGRRRRGAHLADRADRALRRARGRRGRLIVKYARAGAAGDRAADRRRRDDRPLAFAY